MKCPKCGGYLARTRGSWFGAGDEIHCLNCGLYIFPNVPVVMPDIPKLTPLQEEAKAWGSKGAARKRV